MSDEEKLARDICWAEFATPPRNQTKASYWVKIHPDARAHYLADAQWLIWITKRVRIP